MSEGFSNGWKAWKRRWTELRDRYEAVQAENARLRAALDELNADVEEFLSIAHQAGHEAAKTHTIRSQSASIRRMRARIKELEAGKPAEETGAVCCDTPASSSACLDCPDLDYAKEKAA